MVHTIDGTQLMVNTVNGTHSRWFTVDRTTVDGTHSRWYTVDGSQSMVPQSMLPQLMVHTVDGTHS